ncbi:unnamed protein product [Paramecium octaurelia]|uniref:Uncharacterized protein n=1 Tax=Paramecium octaurelia TaxID=43137 RepID=A0A8S1UY50_PAROT|nr:unnamed protein product [Paramecium octaurelia]
MLFSMLSKIKLMEFNSNDFLNKLYKDINDNKSQKLSSKQYASIQIQQIFQVLVLKFYLTTNQNQAFREDPKISTSLQNSKQIQSRNLRIEVAQMNV